MTAQNVVLLLRGINVGGKNLVPMQDLRALLESLGADHVATYIQSGNAVFQLEGRVAAFAEALSDALHAKFGFEPQLMLLLESELNAILDDNPLTSMAAAGKQLHTWIFKSPVKEVDRGRFTELAANGEEFALSDRAFYLYAPNGIGRSKLAAAAEKELGVACTARNANTLQKLRSLLQALT